MTVKIGRKKNSWIIQTQPTCWFSFIIIDSQSVRQGGSRGRGRLGRPLLPKTYENNFFHHDFVQFGKQHSRYKSILTSIVLSQQYCEVYFISLTVAKSYNETWPVAYLGYGRHGSCQWAPLWGGANFFGINKVCDLQLLESIFGQMQPLTTKPHQGRNEVKWRPGQDTSLAPLCSNLSSFGSKCAVEESTWDIVETFLRPRSDSAPHNDLAPGGLCPPSPLSLRPCLGPQPADIFGV